MTICRAKTSERNYGPFFLISLNEDNFVDHICRKSHFLCAYKM